MYHALDPRYQAELLAHPSIDPSITHGGCGGNDDVNQGAMICISRCELYSGMHFILRANIVIFKAFSLGCYEDSYSVSVPS